MVLIWRQVRILYVSLRAYASGLPVYWPDQTAISWRFNDVFGQTAGPIEPTRNAHFFVSSGIVPTNIRVEFAMTFRGLMPAFDVGWSSTSDLDSLLDDIDHDVTHSHFFSRFRVARADSNLTPDADRMRWYNDFAVVEDAAIRLPLRWTTSYSESRVLLRIGLEFTAYYTTLYIQHERWTAVEYSPIPTDMHRTRYLAVLVSNDQEYQDLSLEPRLIRLRARTSENINPPPNDVEE